MIADGIPYNTVGWCTAVPFKRIASPTIVCSKSGLWVWMLVLEQEQITEESGMALCKAAGVLPHGDAGTQDHLYRGP